MHAPKAATVLLFAVVAGGCLGTPTPLDPGIHGSIGVPHHGVITDAVALPRKGKGFARLKRNDARWGNPRLVAAIEAAAGEVARERPGGAPLIIGDLSPRYGGIHSLVFRTAVAAVLPVRVGALSVAGGIAIVRGDGGINRCRTSRRTPRAPSRTASRSSAEQRRREPARVDPARLLGRPERSSPAGAADRRRRPRPTTARAPPPPS